jgi:hypothetical protein
MYKTFTNNKDLKRVGLYKQRIKLRLSGGNITVESELNKRHHFKISTYDTENNI